MDRTKYIVVEFNGLETPILFPAHVGHDDMARSLGITADDVVSAGFVHIYPLRGDCLVVKAIGESITLKVASREEDADLIRKALHITNDEWE